MNKISIITAFIAGIISFISPCVLPLIPAYISYITDVSIEEIKNENAKNKIFIVGMKCILFILGFTIIFVSLGASITFLGKFLSSKFNLFSKIAGIVIVIFGLNTLGIFKFSWVNKEKRFNFQNISFGFLKPILMGMAFAFGWTPCIGPILAAILAYAGTQENFKQGILLLISYSMGLGLPFLLTGIMLNTFLNLYTKIRKYFRIIEIVSGILLITIGILIFTNNFQRLTTYMNLGFNN